MSKKKTKSLTPLAERLERTRLYVEDSIPEMAERVDISEKAYKKIQDGKPLAEKNIAPIAAFLEVSEDEVRGMHPAKTEHPEISRPEISRPETASAKKPSRELPPPTAEETGRGWNTARGSTTLVPTTALGEKLEEIRKAQEPVRTIEGMDARLNLKGSYRKVVKGELPSIELEEKIFGKIAKHLPTLTDERLTVDEIRTLHQTPAKNVEAKAHGTPPEQPSRKK